MTRALAFATTCAGGVALALAARAAGAQQLSVLHVRSFAIAADRATVRAGEPFHVTMTARFDEPVTELDNVTLPDLAGTDVSGDERRCVASSRGSACSETLTLAIAVPGDRTIGPWTLDAVDARTRRPSRFSSNSIVVHVLGPSPLTGIGTFARDLGLAALTALVAIGIVVVAARIAVRLLTRTRPRSPVPDVAAVVASPAAPRVNLDELIDALERDPSRARAVALRDALRASVGAREEETLGDLVARGAVPDAHALHAFGAVERAAFCEEPRVADAVREALPFLRP